VQIRDGGDNSAQAACKQFNPKKERKKEKDGL